MNMENAQAQECACSLKITSQTGHYGPACCAHVESMSSSPLLFLLA